MVFIRAIPSVTVVFWVLPSFTEFYLGLPRGTRGYRVVTESHGGLWGCAEFYAALNGRCAEIGRHWRQLNVDRPSSICGRPVGRSVICINLHKWYGKYRHWARAHEKWPRTYGKEGAGPNHNHESDHNNIPINTHTHTHTHAEPWLLFIYPSLFIDDFRLVEQDNLSLSLFLSLPLSSSLFLSSPVPGHQSTTRTSSSFISTHGYRVFTGFYRVFTRLTGFRWVTPSCSGFYRFFLLVRLRFIG